MVAMMIVAQSCAQTTAEKEVPAKVKTTFSQKFPNAKRVKWDKESETEWEAEFKLNGKEYSANFASDGTWKETEYEIKESEIPLEVKNTIDNEFAGYEIDEVEISETTEGKIFEFELEKGKTEMEVAIYPNGKIVKKGFDDDEDDKDDDDDDKDDDDKDD